MLVADPVLEAYFARVGYDGPREPTHAVLDALTSAHTRSIPFENLDVLFGRPVDLSREALFRKLVLERRGGYCFEQNGLFLHVLEAIGFRVTPLSARVRLDRPRDYLPPRTHVFLRVELDGRSFVTDVGVGGMSLTQSLEFVPDVEQRTPHETRRFAREDGRWFHQVRLRGEWTDVYEFTGEEMPAIDRELANWYTSAYPASHFKNRLLVALAGENGRRLTVLNDEFKIRERDGQATDRRLASPAELLEVLRDYFGLNFPEGTPLVVPGLPTSA